MKRREFLERSITGVGGLLLGSQFSFAGETKKVDPYERVNLGKTDIKMSRFCLGTGMRGGNRQSNHTRMGKDKFEELIRGSFDRGTSVFDLADLYGTHPYVIPALKDISKTSRVISTLSFPRSGGGPGAFPRPNARTPTSS
jgi:1-deoxyxylulose-5-phosphate synthase